jgi:hypothetical protein
VLNKEVGFWWEEEKLKDLLAINTNFNGKYILTVQTSLY